MSSVKTKNDIAWEKLFKKYDVKSIINREGFFNISATMIKEFREPRLAVKFDHKTNLPKNFIDNKLAIVPVTRGDYIIAPMEMYFDFDETEIPEIEFYNLPEHLQSLKADDITSEATALNCAYVSGMLNHFLSEDELFPTVNGRMSSESFSFFVKNSFKDSRIEINVSNSQMEIDGGYEGLDSLCLIEVKNSISTDFHIRQLYYPYRLWTRKIEKPVRLIFMIYTNGIFNLYEYKFLDFEDINSIRMVANKRYSLEHRDISVYEIKDLLKNIKIIQEPEIPFPQADSLERVINLCELLYKSDLTKDEITATYDFDKRQADYYFNAGRYLGLIEDAEMDEPGCKLTPEGYSLLKLQFKNRQIRLSQLILQHSIFAEVLKLYFKKSEEPSKSEVVKIMKSCRLFNMNKDSTYERRASTVISWINWIIELTN